MFLATPLTLTRTTRSGYSVGIHLEASGEVTPDCAHPGCSCLYTVALDRETRNLLWTAEEVERAENALGDKWLALHPYAVGVAA